MTFQSGKDRSFDELVHVGVAIKRVHSGQNHVGVLYRVDDSDPSFCHLAWHNDLRDEKPKESYYWDCCPFLESDPINGKIFAAKMIRVARNQDMICYGIYYEGSPFGSDGTFIKFPETGMGLTCASFVSAVFASLGWPIVEFLTWKPREGDREWQQHIIDSLDKTGASKAHVEAARDHIGALRLRPEDVAVAATSVNPPKRFNEIESASYKLNDQFASMP